MALIRLPRETAPGSCRMCPVRCDRLVYVSGCLESGCPRLYAYEEGGTTWVGCLEKVFAVELDLRRVEAAERTGPGFGGLRVAREPLAVCRCAVDPTFEHRAQGPCRRPEFLLSAPRPAPRAPAGAPDAP